MVESKRKFACRNLPGMSWARKFKLLMWKNFRILSRNKFHTIMEILLPVIFMSSFGLLRVAMPMEKVPEPTVFTPFDLRTIPPVLKTNMLVL
ncbi:unnamed protein product [Allacma fusca]|uniref:Uncharacterized protein n=1 Tax=Allacma fusca TaxID=39272 RepID=A0A8J2KIT9_9HEXA|nr:unnamed protein product [Allacma fusca]